MFIARGCKATLKMTNYVSMIAGLFKLKRVRNCGVRNAYLATELCTAAPGHFTYVVENASMTLLQMEILSTSNTSRAQCATHKYGQDPEREEAARHSAQRICDQFRISPK